MVKWLGIGFVVLGSVPYYALLNALGIEIPGHVTGMVFGAAGTISLVWLAFARRPLVGNRVVVLSFVAFVVWWWLRWATDPPAVGRVYDDFAVRAPVYMFVFGVLPMLCGQFARSTEDARDAVRALAVWGALGMLVSGLYWAVAVRGAAWQPIPALTGTLMAFDCGTGCLAWLILLRGRLMWLRCGLVVFTLAVVVRISERGPFLFFFPALALLAWRSIRSTVLRFVAVPALAAAALATALQVSEAYGTDRVTASESYSTSTNTNRLALYSDSWQYFSERPWLGWGGNLVGRPMHNGDVWEYSHVLEFDPALETGIVGFGLFAAFAVAVARALRRVDRGALMIVAPILLYAALEAQVSGHVSSVRHLWFAIGLVCSCGLRVPERGIEIPPGVPA